MAVTANTQTVAQYNNFVIKKLSQAEGLSQGSNYFVHEDKLGYMWITANDAINRYDGSWIKVYKEERYFRNCPVLKQGYCFAEDKESNIYIGSTTGLYKYNRNQDAFTLLKVFNGYDDENCIPFAFYDNKIWCYNRFYAIAAVDVFTEKVSFYNNIRADAIESIHTYMFSKTSYRYRQPFFDKTGTLWITTKTDIISYNFSKKQAVYYLHDDIIKHNAHFTAVCYDSSNNRIVAGTDSGITVFDIKNHASEFIKNNVHGPIYCIKKINNDFLVSVQNAVTILSGDFTNVFHLDSSNNPEFETSVSAPVCIDKINRLWLCKSGFGLSVLDFAHRTFYKASGYKEDPNYFFKRGTHSFAEYPNGDILIRSGPKLFIKDHGANTISQVKQYTGSIDGLPLRNDYRRNGIWLIYNGNLVLLDCKTNRPVISIDCNKDEYGIVQDIVVWQTGDVWVALSTGVYRIDFTKHQLEAINNLPLPNAFKLNLINKNRIAISYLNSDMLLAQKDSTGNVSVIGKILPGVKSFYIQQDTIQNRFWTGADDGLYLLDESFTRQRKFDATNELSGSYIYGLLLDKENNVWISHEKGLSSINAKTFACINYDEDDNIQDRDYNNRCFFKSEDGTLYFGGIKGFNWFKPPVAIPLLYKPELYIDEIEVNNAPLFADTNYTYVHDLKLTSQQNKLTIHAVIKDLDMIHSNEIIYRFKNLDTLWQHLPANGNIIFNNLAPGDYKLELGYYNTKQKIFVSQKIIAISILSPFYQTIVFWIFVSAAITALLVWNFNQTKLKKQRRLLAQQAALMKERNRITSDLHDDVGSSLSSLQIHSVIAKQLMDSDLDKAKDYLDKVIQQSSDINSDISDIIWSMKSQESRLVDMDGRIRNTISSLLGATNINYTIEIAKELEEEVKNITARKNMMLIVKEAINNCAKYSGATNCQLSVTLTSEAVTMIINDNGKGIPANKMKMGNGLQNMRKRAEELKGMMYLITAKNKGVQLKFIIPATEIRG